MEWYEVISVLGLRCPNLTVEDVTRIVNNQSPRSPKVQQYLSQNINWVDNCQSDLKNLKDRGLKWVTCLSPDYPKSFQWIQNPPVFLSYRGTLAALSDPAIAVVGSREPSSLGQDFLEHEFGHFLEEYPCTVVSGAARGIDQLAHSCALRKRIPTIAVLPAGLDNPYPRDFRKFVNLITDSGGAVISEYPPDQFMQKHFFYRRNQLIVGLSRLVLVIEARRKSGTQMTARHAMNSHSIVAVVPGSPMDKQYGGSLDLIFDGAQLVREASDVVGLMHLASFRHQY